MHVLRAARLALALSLITGTSVTAQPVDFRDMIAETLPVVVAIDTNKINTDPQAGIAAAQLRRHGAGVIVDASGIIVTNDHVIDGALRLTVTLSDRRQFPGSVMARAKIADLALVKIEPAAPLPVARFGNSDQVRLGEPVVAIGNPLGLRGSVSVGIVSALGRDIHATAFDDMIQTDAAFNPGSSGGALVDAQGQVVGIATAIFAPSQMEFSAGLGFAQPSNMVLAVINRMRQKGGFKPGWIGIRAQTISAELAEAMGLRNQRGIIVTTLQKDGPALRAGVEEGDVILTVNDTPVVNQRSLARWVAMAGPGAEARLALWRDGAMHTLTITTEAPPESAKPTAPAEPFRLGLLTTVLNESARHKYDIPEDRPGVLVVAVAPLSAAADAGLDVGEAILRIGQDPVAAPEDVDRLFAAAQAQQRAQVPFLIRGPEGPRWVVVRTR
jgi:serine protease Do